MLLPYSLPLSALGEIVASRYLLEPFLYGNGCNCLPTAGRIGARLYETIGFFIARLSATRVTCDFSVALSMARGVNMCAVCGDGRVICVSMPRGGGANAGRDGRRNFNSFLFFFEVRLITHAGIGCSNDGGSLNLGMFSGAATSRLGIVVLFSLLVDGSLIMLSTNREWWSCWS